MTRAAVSDNYGGLYNSQNELIVPRNIVLMDNELEAKDYRALSPCLDLVVDYG